MNSIDHARQKVESVIEIINSVRELDFPYDDPWEAVEFIREHFKKLLIHLKSINDVNAARNICKKVSDEIDNYLFAVGFMVRACDIQGALELQGPLLRLTHRAIGSHAKLVISSEWRYSPFTLLYPDEFGDKFVLVGLPVSEAGNPLIAPAAGHELGHNIWSRLPELQEFVGREIRDKVTGKIKGEKWDQFQNVFNLSNKEQVGQEDLFDDVYWRVAMQWGVSQCEEIFCDFIGLCVFGEGYLHAFHYLLSPGGGFRNPAYPSMSHRISALQSASATLGVVVPDRFSEEFDDSDVSSDPKQQLLLKTSDEASQELVPRLVEHALTFCEKKELVARDKADVKRIFDTFKRVVPATGAKSLANIINAAWQISLDNVNHWAVDYPATRKPEKRIELIRELALKSFEVFEIERIQE